MKSTCEILLGLGIVTMLTFSNVRADDGMIELTGAEELQAHFNADSGKVRLLLLLSPT